MRPRKKSVGIAGPKNADPVQVEDDRLARTSRRGSHPVIAKGGVRRCRFITGFGLLAPISMLAHDLSGKKRQIKPAPSSWPVRGWEMHLDAV